MAFSRTHIERFINAAGVQSAEAAEIRKRAEDAAAKFDEEDKEIFSGGDLEKVLGSSELAAKFNQMWERQHHLLAGD